MISLISNALVKTARNFFCSSSLLIFLVCILSTLFSVETGLDWKVFLTLQPEIMHTFSEVMGIFGFFLPLFLFLAFFLYGEWKHETEWLKVSGKIAAAEIFALVVTSALKLFTGRVEPPYFDPVLVDLSRDFHFGLYEYSIFWGWPSSHVATTFAGLFVAYWFLKNTTARAIIASYCILMFIATSVDMHWFSDCVAGGLIGYAVARAAKKD